MRPEWSCRYSRRRQWALPLATPPSLGTSGIPLAPSTAFENWTVAITLKGSELTEVILRGYNDVENRNIQLPLGWVALHTGKFRAAWQMCSAIPHLEKNLLEEVRN